MILQQDGAARRSRTEKGDRRIRRPPSSESSRYWFLTQMNVLSGHCWHLP